MRRMGSVRGGWFGAGARAERPARRCPGRLFRRVGAAISRGPARAGARARSSATTSGCPSTRPRGSGPTTGKPPFRRCRNGSAGPHSADYIWRGPSQLTIRKEEDPLTREIIAFHAEWLRSIDNPIYLDGRPHPSEDALHSWGGFATGKWEGDMLTVTVTHLKEGYVRRNGLPRSDRATVTEHWMRHGDFLTVVTIVNDPVYLTEPFIRTHRLRAGPAPARAAVSLRDGDRDRAAQRSDSAPPAGHQRRRSANFPSATRFRSRPRAAGPKPRIPTIARS